MLREAVSDLNRMRKILTIVVRNGFGDMLDRARIFERLGMRKPDTTEDRDRSPAQRFARMLTELGPTFVKMGQLLSTRPDLVPEEYIETLRALQDRVPPFPIDEVRGIFRQEFGRTPEELFASFAPEPTASASIAQVHMATMHDGLEVAVKVKRPGIEHTVRSDLDILYYLAHLIEAVVEETALYDPVEIVKQFDQAVGHEMDLAREADNLRAFAANFEKRDNLLIPRPVEELSSGRVLTMCCVVGRRIEEVEPGSDLARRAALNLVEGFYQQTFEDGFFHADPHPGNLRVMEDGRVGLMDFGQVGTLTASMRSTMLLLGLGIVLKDADTVSRLVYRVGAQARRVDLGRLTRDIRSTLESSLGDKLGAIDTGQVLGRLMDLSQRHQVRIPPEYSLVAKSLATVEGVVRALYPDMEPGSVAAPYVQRMLVERYNLDDLKGGALRALLQLSNFLNEVPRQVSQILLDLESGRLSVNVHDPEDQLMRRTVRRAGIDLFWGLVAAGLLAGSLPAFMSPGDPPAAAVWGLVGSGVIALIVTARYFLTPVLRKMRLKPWLERRWGPGDRRRNKH